MDLPFVRDGRPTEQRIVFIEENDICPSLGQRESDAAALQATSQHPNTHWHCYSYPLLINLLAASTQPARHCPLFSPKRSKIPCRNPKLHRPIRHHRTA